MKYNLFCFLLFILVNLFNYAPNMTASPIINGIPDEYHVFKFHVSIHYKKIGQGEYKYVCGGTILSEKYILSAAHCFVKVTAAGIQETYPHFGAMKIIAGTNLRDGPGIERDVVRVFMPPGTGRQLYSADLAIAELNDDLGVHRRPNKLSIMPVGPLDPRSYAYVNRRATFFGFGLNKLVRNPYGRFVPENSDIPINRFMDTKILGIDECPNFEKLICVTNLDPRVFRSSCFGDSGAGLIYNGNIVGVLSTGPGDCYSSKRADFTRLNIYMRFIEEAQNPRGDHSNMLVLT